MDCREMLIAEVRNELMESAGQDAIKVVDEVNHVLNVLLRKLEHYSVDFEQNADVRDCSTNEQLVRDFSSTLLLEGKSQRTVNEYQSILRRFAKETEKPYCEIVSYDVRRWLALLENDTRLTTRENYRAYLSSFFHWLQVEEYITVNPMDKVKRIRCPKVVRKPYSSIEIDALRNACRTVRDRAIVEILLSSAVRISELAAMNREDIDFNTRQITVKEGKGNKQRMVYISDVCKNYLIKYLSERTDDDECLFYTRLHTRMETTSYEKMLRDLGKRANVVNVHPHRFRRTFASDMARRGMPVTRNTVVVRTCRYVNYNEICILEYR